MHAGAHRNRGTEHGRGRGTLRSRCSRGKPKHKHRAGQGQRDMAVTVHIRAWRSRRMQGNVGTEAQSRVGWEVVGQDAEVGGGRRVMPEQGMMPKGDTRVDGNSPEQHKYQKAGRWRVGGHRMTSEE